MAKNEKTGWFSHIASWFENARQTMHGIKDSKRRSFLNAEVPHLKGKKQKQQMVVDLPPMTVAKGAAVVILMVVLFYFLYEISGIILVFFISFLFAAALDPLIDRLEDFRIPRTVSMLLVYLVLFVLMGFFVTGVVTLVADQVIGIAQSVGEFVSDGDAASFAKIPFGEQIQPYVDQFAQTVNVEAAATQLQNAFQLISTQLVSLSIGLFNLLIVLVLTFFMAVEEKPIDRFVQSIFPSQYAEYIATRTTAVKDQIGLWVRGQLMVSIIAGVASYIGLALMGVDYALTLSLIAGLSMVIPVVGRFFAWVVTFPIVFNQSPALALWMSIYYLIIQQFENNLIVPIVMNKAVGLNPIIIIFALMVGGQYLGILGFVLAIPIATTIAIFVRDYTTKGT